MRDTILRVAASLALIGVLAVHGKVEAPKPLVASVREMDVPEQNLGVYRVEFWIAIGPDPRQITAEKYAEFVAAGTCGPRSSANRFPHEHLIQLVCDA